MDSEPLLVVNPSASESALERDVEEMLVSGRCGTVLGSGTILKFDRYPVSTEDSGSGSRARPAPVELPSVLNYRHVSGFPIHGAGQAGIKGIKQLLKYLGAKETVAGSVPPPHVSLSAGEELLRARQGVGGSAAGPWVMWACMREEPVVYINGRPFVLRELQAPLANVVFQGISAQRVEQMEARLKQDILDEARAHRGKILVHDENLHGAVICRWEPVTSPSSVLTLRELYEGLRRGEHVLDEDLRCLDQSSATVPPPPPPPAGCANSTDADADDDEDDAFLMGAPPRKSSTRRASIDAAAAPPSSSSSGGRFVRYRVALFRIPIAGQQKPLPAHYDEFVSMFARAPDAAQFLFNCQSGRGRTTTGITVGTMLYSLRSEPTRPPDEVSLSSPSLIINIQRNTLVTDTELATAGYSLTLDPFYNNDELYRDLAHAEWARFQRGEYATILNLVRVLHYGKQSKAVVDACVNMSSQMFDLKASILPLMHSAIGGGTSSSLSSSSSASNSTNSSPRVSRSASPSLVDSTGAASLPSSAAPPPPPHLSVASPVPKVHVSNAAESLDAGPGTRNMLLTSGGTPSDYLGGLFLGERRSHSPGPKARRGVSAALLLSSVPVDSAAMPVFVSDEENTAARRFTNSLERYFSLIVFAEYLVLHGYTRIQLLREAFANLPTMPLGAAHQLPSAATAATSASASTDGVVTSMTHVHDLLDEVQKHHPIGVTISKWLETRPEIQHICDKLQHELYIAIDKQKQAMAGTSEKQVSQLLEPATPTSPLPAPMPHVSPSSEPTLAVPQQEAAIIIASRRGSVLCRESLLKSDHFPGCHKTSLPIFISGSPNYRKVAGFPVHGVGQATIDGLRQVLDRLDARNKWILWTSMREEPVIYVNGRPYVVRDADAPFRNIDYTGIDTIHIELIEQRLKLDILREARTFQGRILLHDEVASGIVAEWESVDDSSILTLKEVYSMLADEGYLVSYQRIPITDEEAPEHKDLDQLVERIAVEGSRLKEFELVFNCQMGRGRTTTAMTVGCLVCPWVLSNPNLYVPLKNDYIPREHLMNEEFHLRLGHYRLITDIRAAMPAGPSSKRQLDSVLDLCSTIQNLREAVYEYKQIYRTAATDVKREFAKERFTQYLDRYFTLLLFSEYVDEQAPFLFNTKFVTWMAQHPHYQYIRDQRLELEVDIEWEHVRSPEEKAGIVDHSQGAVLYSGTLLKSNTYDSSLEKPLDRDAQACEVAAPEDDGSFQLHHTGDHKYHCYSIPGIPNYRKVDNFPVHGCGQPTILGIKQLLKSIGAKKGKGAKCALWVCGREEPVVYINGQCYVLRELPRSWLNLKYAGIDADAVASMGQRLKRDVAREAKLNQQRVLVYDESASEAANYHGKLVPRWESIHVGSIQTLENVFEMLQQDGYRVRFVRLPIGSQHAPDLTVLDQLSELIRTAPANAELIFNCQMGRGRTSMLMVCAVLLCNFYRNIPLTPFTLPVFTNSLSQERLSRQDSLVALRSEYRIITRMIRLFEHGAASKYAVDEAIDMCSSLFTNLREAIRQKQELANQELRSSGVHALTQTPDSIASIHHAANYLSRYFHLVAFSEYLHEQRNKPRKDSGALRHTFAEWWRARPELAEMASSVTSDFVF